MCLQWETILFFRLLHAQTGMSDVSKKKKENTLVQDDNEFPLIFVILSLRKYFRTKNFFQ